MISNSRLRGLNLKPEYRTGQSDIVLDFMRPCLSVGVSYCRSVGYFNSSAFEVLGESLSEYIKSGGFIKLVTSVELSEKDYEAIKNGYSKFDLCEKKVLEVIDSQFAGEINDGAMALLSLIKVGRLDIKIAIPKVGSGIYHEKLGIISDAVGDFVVFSGSMNESKSGFQKNFECVDVFFSWVDDGRAIRKRDNFLKLWGGDDAAADVIEFSEAARKKLIKIYDDVISARASSNDAKAVSWIHQEQAKKEFLKHERGILNMATGTGKTRTALAIVRCLFVDDKISKAIICADGNDLLNQWFIQVNSIFKDMGLVIYRNYGDNKELNKFSIASRALIICSRASLGAVIRGGGEKVGAKTIMVCDEVHGMGSYGLREKLSNISCGIKYRLGLSATPEREYDQDGNLFIENFVGPEIFSFGLADAIKAGILTPFNYIALPYSLTDSDRERLQLVYKKQAARAADGHPMTQEEVWIELSKVYKTAEQKIPLFDGLLKSNCEILKRCMVFVETISYGMQVAEVIQRYRPDYHTYFGGQDEEVLKRFASGELELLISCHRLSEGIDIKSTSAVVLFSSSRAKLETVQRIGRCLRVDPGNPSKIALVVDFVRDADESDSSDSSRYNWLKELSQVRRKND